jgi:hypothetical protein
VVFLVLLAVLKDTLMMVKLVYIQAMEDQLIIVTLDSLGMESVVFQDLEQTVIPDSIGMGKDVFF